MLRFWSGSILSSTPTVSWRRPPGSFSRPPGCTMVYLRPESIRYFSALRFQRRMPPPCLPSGARPKLLSMCSGFVPPMELQMTTWPTPAARAASIWARWPSQSTLWGWPSGKPMFGRPVCGLVPPVGFTLAEVPMMRAAQPASAPASAAEPEPASAPSAATSTTTTCSGAAPVSASKASREAAVRVMPTGVKSSGRASILRKA
mmetsp:Transcript_95741/g.297580  ORF Transcript_95741/g.297580 Transcript_95741/m.297580 type:complete len:203 (+) Transcript_95741:396-1004(+)